MASWPFKNDWIRERSYDMNAIDNGCRHPQDVRQWLADKEYVKYCKKVKQSISYFR